jgi:hypothetical protein
VTSASVAAPVQHSDRRRPVDRPIEVVDVGEGPVGEMTALQMQPLALDGVELGRVLRQPEDLDPGPLGQRLHRSLARVDRAVVQDQAKRPPAALGVDDVEPLQENDELGGALAVRGRHDKPP